MTAETLREAAARIRHDVEFGQAHGDESFLLAVADWLASAALTNCASKYDTCNVRESGCVNHEEALAVARAYLGTDPQETP